MENTVFKKLFTMIFVLSVFFALTASSTTVYAGLPSIPLEVQIDRAKYVVVGEIVKIDQLSYTSNPQFKFGYARIAVSEVLKGSPVQTLGRKCITWISPDFRGSSVLLPNKVGDKGIWIITNDDPMSRDYVQSFVPLNRKAEIAGFIEMLRTRKWSKPVNGLSAWAVFSPSLRGNPNIVLAVKNVSDTAVRLPDKDSPNFLIADIKGNKKEYHLSLEPGNSYWMGTSKNIIPPGEILYLYPRSVIIIPETKKPLPAGEYSISLTCQNEVIAQQSDDSETSPAIWTGKLVLPAFKCRVEKE